MPRAASRAKGLSGKRAITCEKASSAAASLPELYSHWARRSEAMPPARLPEKFWSRPV